MPVMRVMRVMLAMLVILIAGVPRALVAEDRMTVRGNYYREASTRVLAPVVYVEKDVPDERFTVGAEYLLDAVTSASIGAGAAAVTGGDFLFTEYRHETTLRLSSKLRNWSLGGYFRYSTESDWISRSFGLSVARELFNRELVEGLVDVESIDHPVTIGPHLTIVVEMHAVSVAVASSTTQPAAIAAF